MLDEILDRDGLAQAELVRRREVSAAELVEAAIERIEKRNPALNAVVTTMYEQARATASSPLEGPFAGVPFLLKDLSADYAGVPTRRGSVFFKDVVPQSDSELVRRFKGAGLVVLGKTNTPELGLTPTTEPHLYGPTHNPWALERTAGGSSGGAAAAVAGGLVALAHGSDGGGSLRIPASCCGLFALKPSRGRVPGLRGALSFLATNHAITRSVRDSAALLDVTAERGPEAPPMPEGSFLDAIARPPARLRIGVSTWTFTDTPLHSHCRYAVLLAAKLCAELGHEVVEAHLPIDGEALVDAFTTVWTASCAYTIDAASTAFGRRPALGELEPLTWAIYEAGRARSAVDYLRALDVFGSVTTDTARFFETCDVWLSTTLGYPAPLLGELTAPRPDPLDNFRRGFEFVPVPPLFNVTGQPAMSVPLHWDTDGLPIGVHFAARYGAEATLLRLAAQLEQARPWAHKRPVF